MDCFWTISDLTGDCTKRPGATPESLTCAESGAVLVKGVSFGVQVSIKDDPEDQETEILKTLTIPSGRIQRVAWTDLNATLISAGEDGFVRRWDVEVHSFSKTGASQTQPSMEWLAGLSCLTARPLPCSAMTEIGQW